MLEPSSSTDTPLDVGEEDEEAAGLTEHGPADEKQALKKADHGFLFPPPVIELRGREVILAIGLFLVFAVCIGLVVVMVTKNAKKRKLEESSGSSGQQVSHIGPADDGYDQDVCLTEACIRQSAYIIQSRDANIDPCEDFWKYTCGKWIETNPIPADRKFWSVNAAVEKQMTHRLKTLIEGLVTSQSPNSAQLKVKRFYQKCVDENVIDTDGLKEVSSYIDQLGGWAIHEHWRADGWDFQAAFTKLQYDFYTNVLFTFGVGLDDKSSSKNILQFDQCGLGMPHKSYYFRNESDLVLVSYKKFMRQVALALGGSPKQAQHFVNETFAFEKSIAKITVSENAPERADPRKMYNKRRISQLQQMAPMIDWLKFLQFKFRNISANTEIVLSDPNFITKLSELVRSTSKRTLNYYIVWCFLTNYATDFAQQIRGPAQEYNMKEGGTSKVIERSQYCIEQVTDHLGLALGSTYVSRYFSQKSKKAVTDMITKIRDSFREKLKTVKWMDTKTRQKAIQKLQAMKYAIGYPDFITNHTRLDSYFKEFRFDQNSTYFHVIIASNRFRVDGMARRLQSGEHNVQWDVPPHEVNAFYSPNENLMAFPAGILQSPYFDKEMPWYVNYGSIGSTIGHELTHGFDSFGSRYDESGNLKNWWSPASRRNFTARTTCITQHYANYQIDGQRVDGNFTLEENIADIGGLQNAYHAYKKWEAEHGRERPLPGVRLTNDQAFFFRYAQNWCSVQRPELLHDMLVSNPHAPAQFRVKGTLSQIKEFAEAYKCKPNTKMNPSERCSIW